MRQLIISCSFLLVAIFSQAAPVSGIRIESRDIPIIVYLNGQQICMPTTTCFIANLCRGSYSIEIYSTRFPRATERIWKGKLMYNQDVYFNGNEIKDIFVSDRDRPDSDEITGRPSEEYHKYGRAMNDELFEEFFRKAKDKLFKDDRLDMIKTALTTSAFSSEQCRRLTGLYVFDDDKMQVMKLMFPRIVDKERFFTVIDLLIFSSSKEEMNKFVRERYN